MLAEALEMPVIPLVEVSAGDENQGTRKKGRPKKALKDRLWAKVDRRGPDECWPWLGATNNCGYGVMFAARGEVVRVHRAVYELEKGPIPAGKLILHRCHTRNCCNPRHLRPGTHRENMVDMVKTGRNEKVRKLTDDQVFEIVKLRAERKLPYKTIGLMFNVTGQAISLICRGKTYSWLTGIGLEIEERRAA